MLQHRRRPALALSTTRHTALLALVLLAAVPAAAQGRTFKVDGRITGSPTVKGGAVTAPLKLTPRAARALRFGTRSVRVRLAAAAVRLGRASRAARADPAAGR